MITPNLAVLSHSQAQLHLIHFVDLVDLMFIFSFRRWQKPE